MTVNMLTAYPEYFAAAFPVCEAYEEAWLDDEKIARLKNIPIWMTAAKSDRMVLTENHSSALYNRLVAAGKCCGYIWKVLSERWGYTI